MKMDVYASTPKPQFPKVRHSRMLLAGIQGKPELDPRLKHSGVTPLGVASLRPNHRIFKGEHEAHEVRIIQCAENRKERFFSSSASESIFAQGQGGPLYFLLVSLSSAHSLLPVVPLITTSQSEAESARPRFKSLSLTRT